jgi:hypothetical protein
MKHLNRRRALQLVGFSAAAMEASALPAAAQEFAQAAAGTPQSPDQKSISSVPPGTIVNGTYEQTYQEGYAPALLAVGFSEDTLFKMFSTGPQRMTITTTPTTLALQTKGQEELVFLGSPRSTQVFGIEVKDWLARFDDPARMLISFTAPDGRQVRATQTYHPEGYLTLLSIEGAPQFNPIRVWTRVSRSDERRKQRPALSPI